MTDAETIAMLKEQLRVADVCSHYHMRRSFMADEANANANKAIEGLCAEIQRLYARLGWPAPPHEKVDAG